MQLLQVNPCRWKSWERALSSHIKLSWINTEPDAFFTGRYLEPVMELNPVVSFFFSPFSAAEELLRTLTFLRKVCSFNNLQPVSHKYTWAMPSCPHLCPVPIWGTPWDPSLWSRKERMKTTLTIILKEITKSVNGATWPSSLMAICLSASFPQ